MKYRFYDNLTLWVNKLFITLVETQKKDFEF